MFKRRPLFLLFAAALAGGMVAASPTQAAPARGGHIQQLRIYELLEPTKAAFHARFRDHAARIMKRHGFTIVAMWETEHEGRPQFVYLLDWPNEAAMKTAWARFMADAEWSEIKKQSSAQNGRMMGGIEERVLHPTDYSPRLRTPR